MDYQGWKKTYYGKVQNPHFTQEETEVQRAFKSLSALRLFPRLFNRMEEEEEKVRLCVLLLYTSSLKYFNTEGKREY